MNTLLHIIAWSIASQSDYANELTMNLLRDLSSTVNDLDTVLAIHGIDKEDYINAIIIEED